MPSCPVPDYGICRRKACAYSRVKNSNDFVQSVTTEVESTADNRTHMMRTGSSQAGGRAEASRAGPAGPGGACTASAAAAGEADAADSDK